MDRNMILTVDEYLAFRRLLDSEKESEGSTLALRKDDKDNPAKKTRKKTKRDRVLSQELAIMNKRFRNKNGQLRKGATQSKIMTMAQKATTKRMRK